MLSLLDRRDGGLYGPEDMDRAALFAELAITALDVEPGCFTGLGETRTLPAGRRASARAGPRWARAGSARLRQVALAGGEGDRALAAEVADGDPAARDLGQRAVAAVGGHPDRAAHGCGGVAPARSEAAPGVGAQAPDRPPRELRRAGPAAARAGSG